MKKNILFKIHRFFNKSILLNSLIFLILFNFNLVSAQFVDTKTLSSNEISDSSFTDICHDDLTTSRVMKVTRIDRHAPCGCKPFSINQFSDSDIDYFIGGINSTKGADEKINLSRSEATTLWNSLNASKSESHRKTAWDKLSKDQRLLGYYNSLKAMKDIYGFDFVVEGETLEALWILNLEDKYPAAQFFATGGIMYFEKLGTNVIGELDLVVYEKTSCSVVSVGEAKLSKSTSKAREQIARFRGFLRKQGRN